ncbi:MAG: prolyl oligopeptidase family serine peptidase [Alphaproteobacteria bacterium]|nr:prolyl oligopeptidase family serine peptidase [Alphaproteobacteria bacterium]MCB9794767.1 prolyl oligopeptidase family serine peptidase [Alphaproteobacteria bacterium]
MLALLLALACGKADLQDPDHTGITADDSATASDDSGEGADDSAAPAATCGDGVAEGAEACDEGEANGLNPCGCQEDCQYTPVASACDDGLFCTEADACDGAGACLGAPLSCDDSDACTTDTCDEEADACLNEGFDGEPLDLWDMAALGDPGTLDVEVLSTERVWEGFTQVEVSELRYTAWESEACALNPVRIEAYLAVPVGASAALPGLVVAHGLGGEASPGAASTPAAELGVVALAYSGPGQGASEGTGSTSDHLFDTVPHPRNSWFWEHAAAAIRGLTLLESLPEVDPARLAMTGYSGGGVATLMVNGVDARVQAAVPVSAVGSLDSAARATPVPGWEYDLLQDMSPARTPDDAEWQAYLRWLDPINYAPTAHGPTLLINGAQDEFFPIDSTRATLDALQAAQPEARLLSIKDWDHGWYALFNDEEPAAWTRDALTWWMQGHLGLDSSVSAALPMPQVDALIAWTCLYDNWYPYSCAAVQASLSAPTGYSVESARFHFSADNALTFATWNLQESNGVWQAEIGTLDGSVYGDQNLVYFVEFELSSGWLGQTIRLSSAPHIPPGFSPNIIPIDGPLAN